MARIYIILVNYHNVDDTLECIYSILKSTYKDFKIIIVDNSVDDRSINTFRSRLLEDYNCMASDYSSIHDFFEIINQDQINIRKCEGKITVVRSFSNGGFAAGNNIGIKLALHDPVCEYVWLLNNDTTICNNTLSDLYTFAENHLQVGSLKNGIVSSKLNSYYDRNRVQGVYGKYNKLLCVSRHVVCDKISNKLNQQINRSASCYPIGACMFIKKEFILDVGLMSTDYFLYFEELDWVVRAKRKGWGFSICPDTVVYHKEGGSIGASVTATTKSIVGDFYSIRNRILFTTKYYPWLLLFAYFSLMISLFNRIRRGNKARIDMVLWIIRHYSTGFVDLKSVKFYKHEK